jgi:hypothetical protein
LVAGCIFGSGETEFEGRVVYMEARCSIYGLYIEAELEGEVVLIICKHSHSLNNKTVTVQYKFKNNVTVQKYPP